MKNRNKEILNLCTLDAAKSADNPLPALLVFFNEQRIKDMMMGCKRALAQLTKKPCSSTFHLVYQTFTGITLTRALDVVGNVFSYSMFTHRVLPLPPQLYVAAEPIPQCDSRDNLQKGNTSRHDCRGSTGTMINARKASLRSSSPSRTHFSTVSERGSPPDDQKSALVLRSSSGSRRKRTSSQDSVEEIQRSDRAIPSISPPSTLTELEGSPSQVCLCQPDPKVPRPRNGRLLLSPKHNA